MSDSADTDRCPRCDSPAPNLHPAVQHEGEVQPCPHPFHGDLDPLAVLDRTEILHRVLALCAETDAITHVYDQGGWLRLRPHNKLTSGNLLSNIGTALTSLQRAKLITWQNALDRPDTQYFSATSLGEQVLLRWDAELLGGGS